jgi:hypothetical protein
MATLDHQANQDHRVLLAQLDLLASLAVAVINKQTS